MKVLAVAIILVLFRTTLLAQTLPDFQAIKLEVKEDYNAKANDAALQAANYVLSNPMDAKDNGRIFSTVYLIRWMQGTPDYLFNFDEQATKFAKKNSDFLALYMAAMVKYVLENKSDAKDQDKIRIHALQWVISYFKEPKFNAKPNKEIKKLMEADDKGQLQAYLKQ